MEQLIEYLNAEKTDLMEILFSKNLPDGRETREWFTKSVEQVIAEIDPILKAHLQSLNLQQLASTASSQQELEELYDTGVRLFPDNFNTQLVISIDKLTGFNMPQKFWIFSATLQDFTRAAQEHARIVFQKRAQEITNFRRRILT